MPARNIYFLEHLQEKKNRKLTKVCTHAHVNTTKHGLNCFKYFAVKQWNSIPNELRLKAGSLEFNKQVRNIEF